MSKIHKEIILGVAVALLGAFFWYFLKYVFYVGNLTPECWALGIILIIAWGIALCLAMLLINNKKVLYGSFALVLISFGIFFNNEPFYYLVGLIILLLAFWSAKVKVRKEEKVEVTLNFWRIWRRGLPIFITALCLMISLIYYFSPKLTTTIQKEIKIPRNVFNLIIEPLEGLILEKLSGEVASLDAEAIKILNSQQIQELKQNYGIEIKEGETIKDFLYNLVNYQINNIAGPYKKFIPIGLAIALFIGLKIISLLYIPFVVLFSWLALKLLILLGFAKVEIETKEVETVKL